MGSKLGSNFYEHYILLSLVKLRSFHMKFRNYRYQTKWNLPEISKVKVPQSPLNFIYNFDKKISNYYPQKDE